MEKKRTHASAASVAVIKQTFIEPRTQNEHSNQVMTPESALELLKAGNRRFMQGTQMSRPIRQQFRETADGQYPFAAILACLDSRTSPELVFDLNNGDAFSARVAGNVINDEILGSMEFAIEVSAKLIAVVGHTACGAVRGTIKNRQKIDNGQMEPGYLQHVLRRIRPALDRVDAAGMQEEENTDAVARENVKLVMEEIRAKSADINEAISSRRVQIWGAMHDLRTGEVSFFQ